MSFAADSVLILGVGLSGGPLSWRFETASAPDITHLLHALLEARGRQSNPNSHVSNWEEEHQVRQERAYLCSERERERD